MASNLMRLMKTPKLATRRKLVKDAIKDAIDRPVTLLNPSYITNDLLLRIKPAEIDDIEWVDKCRWIIHSIINQQLKLDPDLYKPYVPLHSRILKANLGNYTIFINTLIAHGIIDCDNKYSIVGGKSKGYRLITDPHYSELIYFGVRCKKLIKAIKNQRKEKADQLIIVAKPITSLVYWLTTNDLKIDKESALQLLENYRKTYLSKLEQYALSTKELETAKVQLERSCFYARHSIEHFNTNNFTIDDAGRLYSSLTNLPALYRHYLSYQGKRLVSIDIKNSHPFHILFLLQSTFWSNKGENTLHKVDSKLSKRKSASYLTKRDAHPPSIKLQKNTFSTDYQYTKMTSFRELVLSGKLYEFICFSLYGLFIDNDADRFATRDQAKAEMLHMMYHNPKERHSPAKAVFKAFKKLFPEVAAIIELLKANDYTHFPVILQHLEAHLILNKICNTIYQKNPSIPLFTIHDSILTTEEHLDIIKSTIQEVYQDLLGDAPKLSCKTLDTIDAEIEMKKLVRSKIKAHSSKLKPNKRDCDMITGCEHHDFENKLRKELQQHQQAIIPTFLQYIVSPQSASQLRFHT